MSRVRVQELRTQLGFKDTALPGCARTSSLESQFAHLCNASTGCAQWWEAVKVPF